MSSVLSHCLQAIRPQIKKIKAYSVADATGLIKLDAMENPYALPVELQQQLQQKLANAPLNRYPDPHASALRQRLKDVMQVPENSDIMLGNGSDELILLLAMALAKPKASLLSFEPGFVMYKMIAEFVDIDYVSVALKPDFSLDMKETLKAIAQHQPAVIFIAFPNNPSANCFAIDDIEQIIQIAPGLVVLDEAYHPFAQRSFMAQLKVYDNLLLMRTVSKMGLAGLRLGLLCGHPDIITEINKIRLPYNINVLTQITAEFVLDNIVVLDAQAELIRHCRQKLLTKMKALKAIEVFESDANFILFRVLTVPAVDVFEKIKQAGVLIKNMKADKGLLKNCLRVTVGTDAENDAFLLALKNSLLSVTL